MKRFIAAHTAAESSLIATRTQVTVDSAGLGLAVVPATESFADATRLPVSLEAGVAMALHRTDVPCVLVAMQLPGRPRSAAFGLEVVGSHHIPLDLAGRGAVVIRVAVTAHLDVGLRIGLTLVDDAELPFELVNDTGRAVSFAQESEGFAGPTRAVAPRSAVRFCWDDPRSDHRRLLALLVGGAVALAVPLNRLTEPTPFPGHPGVLWLVKFSKAGTGVRSLVLTTSAIKARRLSSLEVKGAEGADGVSVTVTARGVALALLDSRRSECLTASALGLSVRATVGPVVAGAHVVVAEVSVGSEVAGTTFPALVAGANMRVDVQLKRVRQAGLPGGRGAVPRGLWHARHLRRRCRAAPAPVGGPDPASGSERGGRSRAGRAPGPRRPRLPIFPYFPRQVQREQLLSSSQQL
jgi:hypothetical protein